MRLGLFGGTFNPVHFGHLRAAEEVREALSLDKVLFVPAGTPPLKSAESAAAADRLRMVELAVHANPGFEVSEHECAKEGKSFTVQTVAELGALRPGAELTLILGIDAFLDIPRWHSPDELVSMVDFAVISRPGFDFGSLSSSPYVRTVSDELVALDAGGGGMVKEGVLRGGRRVYFVSVSTIDISATGIRRRIGRGASVRYMLPKAVESYIIYKGLYLNRERGAE